jgi:hypothetical protein
MIAKKYSHEHTNPLEVDFEVASKETHLLLDRGLHHITWALR